MKDEIINVIMIWDTEVEYFLNDWWEIVWNAPNPFPQPYIYFYVKKVLNKKLSKQEKQELISLSFNN